jgi:hypothetical protein
MLCDPAFFFDARLNGPAFESGFSHRYVSHSFRTHFLAAADVATKSPPITRLFGGELRVAEKGQHFLCRRGPAIGADEPSGQIAGNRLP